MLKVYTETINVEINIPSAKSVRATNAESLHLNYQCTNQCPFC